MDSSSFSNPSSSHSTSAAARTTGKVKGSKRKKGGGGVKLSTDPQGVAARQRRHRISDRFKTLQSLIPGGSKMDTVSMLEEAIQYVKFLKTQIWLHQAMIDLVENAAGEPDGGPVRPSHCQNADNLCLGGHVEAGMGDVALSELCWISGGESGGFGASDMQRS